MTPRSSFRGCAAICAWLLLLACTDVSTPVTSVSVEPASQKACRAPGSVESLEVSPRSLAFDVGEAVQLTATARSGKGNTVSVGLCWQSSDSNIATVSQNGDVAAVARGGPITIRVFTTAGARVVGDSVSVTVRSPVASVEITPRPTNLMLREVIPLTVTTRDADGNVIADRATAWTSSNPTAASVSSTGELVGLSSAWPVTITAAVDGVSSSIELSVLPFAVALKPDPAFFNLRHVVALGVDGAVVEFISSCLPTSVCGGDLHPRLSPDGRQVVFHRVSPITQMLTVNADGTQQTALGTWFGEDDLPNWPIAWGAGGLLALAPDLARGEPCFRDFDILTLRPDGSGRQNVTNTLCPEPGARADEFAPEWSPDGSRLYFMKAVLNVDGVFTHSVLSANPDGTGLTLVTTLPSGGTQIFRRGRVGVSPNGARLAVVTADNPAQLLVMNSDGSNLRQVTFDSNQKLHMRWTGPNTVTYCHDEQFFQVNVETEATARIWEGNGAVCGQGFDWNPLRRGAPGTTQQR